jgi:hypothetical protein
VKNFLVEKIVTFLSFMTPSFYDKKCRKNLSCCFKHKALHNSNPGLGFVPLKPKKMH